MCRNNLPAVTERSDVKGRSVIERLSQFVSFYEDDLSGGLLLAVSGGSDSLALLYAVASLPDVIKSAMRVSTVDHGLRPEARAEAEMVGDVCNRLDIPHDILTLKWDDAASVSQAQARRARYAALAANARAHGLAAIATGHTYDDQLETVFIREGAGSGLYGLAGMADVAPLPVWPEGYDLSLVRPLLTAGRHDLREFLKSFGAEWVEDPSNTNTAFERVRVRNLLSDNPDEVKRLERVLGHAISQRISDTDQMTGWAAQHVDFLVGGAAEFDVPAFSKLEQAWRLRFLMALLTAVGGKEDFPRQEKAEALIDLSGCEAGRTLHGCRLQVRDGVCLVAPEPVPLADVLRLEPQRSEVWKGRTLLTRADSYAGPSLIASWEAREVPRSLDRGSLPRYDIRRSLPVILNDAGEVTEVPHLQDGASVCPRDLSQARFYKLLQFKAQFFATESRQRESFS